jgi:hypothetical protein
MCRTNLIVRKKGAGEGREGTYYAWAYLPYLPALYITYEL